MSDRTYLDSLLPDFGEYSLDSILESCRQRAASSPDDEAAPEDAARSAEAIARRSRQIVMEALGDTLRQYRDADEDASEGDGPIPALDPALTDELVSEVAEELPYELEPDVTGDDEPPQPPHWTSARPQTEKPRRKVSVSPDGIITVSLDLDQVPEGLPVVTDGEEGAEDFGGEEEYAGAEGDFPEDEDGSPDEEEERPGEEEGSSEDEDGYSDEEEEFPEEEEDEGPPARERRPVLPYKRDDKPGLAERFLLPLIHLAAVRFARRQMQKEEAANWPEPVEYEETEELSCRQAAKFFSRQLRPLRFRLRVCFFLCIVSGWIALGLPMAGGLGWSLTIQAGVSLLLLLTVMISALDILAAGMRQLFDLHPGGEALATLASLFSAVDALMVVMGRGDQLPFCAVGAAALTFAVWGEKLSCAARARSLRTASMSRTPSVLGSDPGKTYLHRTQQTIDGVVRRTEQPDFCQTVYMTAAPIFLLLCVLLAVLASLGGKWGRFLHTFSALLAVTASFSAFLSFPLPYALISRKLQSSGAAIAGYPGCADIGEARQVVVSDNDIFPPGTVRLSAINILEGAFVDKVISYTTCFLTASGSGIAGLFMELVTRRGYSTVRAQTFKCHEGGGLSGSVNDDEVLVGSAGFMNLMGIRLPRNMSAKNAVCTAINNELVGVFALEYIPVTSVQEALVTLLQSWSHPIFAIRDFNITPLMIRQLFRMPTDNFNFPPFKERYRMTADMGRSAVAAVLTRAGMGPMADAAVYGRKLYSSCRIGTIISLAGTVIGLLTMFLLCRAGSYETATAGNVLSYMLLWALPVMILSFGQTR